MAKVRPYGDPNAHGPLNKSICFRRYRNQVIMQTFPNPYDPASPLQLQQRAKLIAANKAWTMTKGASRFFYRKRAAQRRKTGKSLFMWAYMNQRIPSTHRPIFCKSIESMIAYYVAGTHPNEIEFLIFDDRPFPVDVMWNTLEDRQDNLLISNYGPDGSVYGTINQVPAKFGDGVVQGSLESGVRFVSSIMDSSEGYYCCWVITDFDVVDGRAVGTTYNNWIQCLGNFGTPFYTIFLSPTAQRQLRVDLGWYQYSFAGNTGINWTAGTPVHLAVAWDSTKQFGWSSRVYIDGAVVGEQLASYTPPAWGTSTFNLFSRPAVPDQAFGRIIIDDLLVSKSVLSLQYTIDNRQYPGSDPPNVYGTLLDNSNVYTKFQEVPDPYRQVIQISTLAGFPTDIPFRYLISVEWINLQDEIVNSVIRLPELRLEALQVVYLYLSRDWSVYWDEGLTKLACTNWV